MGVKAITVILWRSVLGRPFTTLYVLASLVIIALSAGALERGQALVIIAVVFLVLLLLGLQREARIEAKLVLAEVERNKAEVDSIKMMLINAQLLDTKEIGKSDE